MCKDLKDLLEQSNKEREVYLALNCNCEGCENGEFEIVDIYECNKSGLSEDFIVVYHGRKKYEAMIAIMKYVRNAKEREV